MKFGWLVVVVSMMWSVDADARSFRVSQYPNGINLGCGACHNNAAGGGPRTGFGEQVFDLLPVATRTSAPVPWADLAALDGDSDGYSNGLELGDPDGTWVPGDPNPPEFTDPADRESNLCGDGILNGNEQCDSDPMGATCADQGFEGEGVVCNDRCRLNFDACTDPATNNLVGEPANNSTANNSTANNTSTGANNSTANNSTTGANNTTANNSTGANNGTSGGDIVIGGDEDDDSACSTAGSTPGLLALVLGLMVLGRRRWRE